VDGPWTDQSDEARRTRLGFSAATLGFLLGLLFYVKWPGVVWFSNDNGTKAWFSFAGVPLVLIAITFLLESLKREIQMTAPKCPASKLRARPLLPAN
jgi:hypothetical protein